MYVVAFGVSMPVSQFLREVAPHFLLPMWPLLVITSAIQVIWLIRAGVTRDKRAWKFGFVVLLSPLVALFIRVLIYLLGAPDYAPFAGPRSTTQYVLTITMNSLLSALIAYGSLSFVACIGKKNDA